MIHKPVLLHEAIEILNPQPGEFFIDGTIGSGGHAMAILEKIGPKGKLLGIDWDKDAIKRLSAKGGSASGGKDFKNVILVNDNYANLPEILKELKKANPSIPLRANGLIIDLGFSSEQLESGRAPNQSKLGTGRGFSFLRNEILDMRYDSESKNPTAAEVVNSFSEKDLAEIFYKYGEERFSRQIAKKIVEERKKKRILTTFDLTEAIKKAVPRNYERGRIHPATRTFQALRIYVNDELGNLEKLLNNLPKILKAKGRAAIISFHSLEDRLVKNAFRELKTKKIAEILTKKPITPTIEEIRQNPRSRSAKMRAIQLI